MNAERNSVGDSYCDCFSRRAAKPRREYRGLVKGIEDRVQPYVAIYGSYQRTVVGHQNRPVPGPEGRGKVAPGNARGKRWLYEIAPRQGAGIPGGIRGNCVNLLLRPVGALFLVPTFPPGFASLRPGTRLLRDWHGDRYEVTVKEDGFLYEGKCYKSLTAVARAITGSGWSGNRFFGLTQSSRSKREKT